MNDTTTYTEFSNSPLFRGLGDGAVRELYVNGSIAAANAGDVIMTEGEPLRDFFIVLSGQLEVSLPKTDARFTGVHLSELGPGQPVGEYSLIDEHPASASVKTLTGCLLFTISQQRFQELLDATPEVGKIFYQNLLALMVSRLREDNRELDLFGPYR